MSSSESLPVSVPPDSASESEPALSLFPETLSELSLEPPFSRPTLLSPSLSLVSSSLVPSISVSPSLLLPSSSLRSSESSESSFGGTDEVFCPSPSSEDSSSSIESSDSSSGSGPGSGSGDVGFVDLLPVFLRDDFLAPAALLLMGTFGADVFGFVG